MNRFGQRPNSTSCFHGPGALPLAMLKKRLGHQVNSETMSCVPFLAPQCRWFHPVGAFGFCGVACSWGVASGFHILPRWGGIARVQRRLRSHAPCGSGRKAHAPCDSGPKAHKVIAQGIALGLRATQSKSPNGAEQRGVMPLVSPRWGFWFLRDGCSWGVAPGFHILPRWGGIARVQRRLRSHAPCGSGRKAHAPCDSGPKAHKVIAQGIALGLRATQSKSPNGAEQRGVMPLVSPRWGFWFLRGCMFLGRCPRLSHFAPLGRNRKSTTPIAIPCTMRFRAKGPCTMRFRAKGPQGDSPGHRPGFAGHPIEKPQWGGTTRCDAVGFAPLGLLVFAGWLFLGRGPRLSHFAPLRRDRKRATPIAIPCTMWFRAKGPCTMRFRAKGPQGDSRGHRLGFAQRPCVSNSRIKRAISRRRTPRSPLRSRYRKSPFGDKCIS